MFAFTLQNRYIYRYKCIFDVDSERLLSILSSLPVWGSHRTTEPLVFVSPLVYQLSCSTMTRCLKISFISLVEQCRRSSRVAYEQRGPAPVCASKSKRRTGGGGATSARRGETKRSTPDIITIDSIDSDLWRLDPVINAILDGQVCLLSHNCQHLHASPISHTFHFFVMRRVLPAIIPSTKHLYCLEKL